MSNIKLKQNEIINIIEGIKTQKQVCKQEWQFELNNAVLDDTQMFCQDKITEIEEEIAALDETLSAYKALCFWEENIKKHIYER